MGNGIDNRGLPKLRRSKPGDLRTIDDDEGVELTLACKRVGFAKTKNSENHRNIVCGEYQTQRTGKDCEYARTFVTLAEIADLDSPSGCKGNYMMFPLKE